jgi:hypothetical protein
MALAIARFFSFSQIRKHPKTLTVPYYQQLTDYFLASSA